MKVLLLPANVASDLSHKVRALKTLGVEARGLAFGGHATQTTTGVKLFSPNKNHFFNIRFKQLQFFARMVEWIKWADVLHWIWDFGSVPFRFDKQLVKWFDKPGVIQWCGSDVRMPETTSEVNPYYQAAFHNGYEYKYESRETSLKIQRDFADVNFYPLEFIGIDYYIDQNLFPKRFKVWQSIVLNEHVPSFPALNKEKPLLLHSPTAPVTKGTKFVLEAVEQLKTKYDFDFKLVQGMPRSEALHIMKNCDVYIDQLIIGAHGIAAVEAMAFGKPVVCYINPAIGKNYPSDLPIINANPDNLIEKLEPLIRDGNLRHAIGKKSRAYAEKYHDDQKIGRELIQIYEEVIRLHQERRRKN